MTRHWILLIAFAIGVVMTVGNLIANRKDTTCPADYRSLNHEYNLTMLILFAALAYDQLAEIFNL